MEGENKRRATGEDDPEDAEDEAKEESSPPEELPPPEDPSSPSPGPKTPSAGKSPSRSVTLDVKSANESYRSQTPKSVLSERRVSLAEAPSKGSPRKLTPDGEEGTAKMGSDQGRTSRSAVVAAVAGLSCGGAFLQKRSPFVHNPPQPEERRPRIQCPRTPVEYIINLREDLADFQESHGLPRTRDYSFVSLGLALAQETGRAIYSLFLMVTELFPVLAILSLILRFALDKLIEILETTETATKIKKSVIFVLEMLAIMIPLWILTATIIIPLITLILSIFKKILRFKGGKKKVGKSKQKGKVHASPSC